MLLVFCRRIDIIQMILGCGTLQRYAGVMKHQGTLRKPGVELRQTLATNIRLLRLRLGVSQEELADMCSLHRTYVGAIERAERNVTLSTLEVFSKALGVPVPDLLNPRAQRHDQKK